MLDVVALPDPLLAAAWVRGVASRNPTLVAACEQEALERGTSCTAIIAAQQAQPKKPSRYAKQVEEVKQRAASRRAGKPVKPKGDGKWDETKHSRKPGGGAGGGQFSSKGSGGGGGGGGKTAKDKEAEAAKKAASKAWDDTEALRKAEDKAKAGSYASLISLAERRESAARKAVDLAEDPTAKRDAQVAADEAATYLADVHDRADKAKADKDAAKEKKKADDKAERDKKIADAKAEREKKSADAKTEREKTAATKKATNDQARAAQKVADETAKAEAQATAKQAVDQRYAEALAVLREQYAGWEKDIRRQHADDGLTDAQMTELVLRDRIRRLRTNTASIQPPALVAFGDFTPDLHPRGKDGKFIEKFGLVDVFGLGGFQHGQRGSPHVQGEIAEIIPNPKKPGDPTIRVKMTDPRWDPKKFGPTVDVKRSQIAQRTTPKAKLPGKAPTPSIAKGPAKAPIFDSGPPPPRTALPGMTPHPDGPHLAPIELPETWETMDNPARLKFITDRMDADLSAWRGEPTTSDFTGMDAGIAFNLANTYRDLVNWDPDTARRIDHPILPSVGGSNGLKKDAIAVAQPGTAHPGGIGEKVKPSSIVFGVKYATGMGFWQKQQAMNEGAEVPWSTSSITGDPTVTLVHEFGHHRQFRFLDVAMRDADKAWTDVVQDDGFGLVPDSSNWAETQALRFDIQKQVSTKYGQSKSSEGFAEGIAEQALGIASPELTAAFAQWDAYMGLMPRLPADRHWDSRSFGELTGAEKDQYWRTHGQYLDLPGMRDHYPDTAAAYDAWSAGKPTPVPTGQSGITTKAANWDEDEIPSLPALADQTTVAPTPQGAHVAVLDRAWARGVIDTTIRARYERDTAYIESQLDAGVTYYNIEFPDGTGTSSLGRWVYKRRLGQPPEGDAEKDYAAMDTLIAGNPNNRRLNHWAKRIAHGTGEDHWEPDASHPELNTAVDDAIAANATNPRMAAAVNRFGQIPVAVVKTDHNAAARALGVGTTVIMNDPLEWGEPGDPVELDGPIVGPSGDAWTVSKGLAGTLRHEYGHYVETMVDNGAGPELAEPYARWREAYKQWNGGNTFNAMVGTDIGKMDAAGPGGLSKYARANSMEGFAETFALVTHPDFDRSTIPDGSPLADMVDAMIDLIGVAA